MPRQSVLHPIDPGMAYCKWNLDGEHTARRNTRLKLLDDLQATLHRDVLENQAGVNQIERSGRNMIDEFGVRDIVACVCKHGRRDIHGGYLRESSRERAQDSADSAAEV